MNGRRRWGAEEQARAETLRAAGLSYARIGEELGGWSNSVVRTHLDPEVHERRKASARERMRRRYETPEGLEAARAERARHRENCGRPSRSKNGLPYRYREDVLCRNFVSDQAPAVGRLYRDGWDVESIRSWLDGYSRRQRAIARAGRRSLSNLLFDPVRFPGRVVFSDPDAARRRHLARYHAKKATDPAFVLAMRVRAHTRRERIRRHRTAEKVTGRDVRARFRLFQDACAYCGRNGELQIEHVIPLSQGGLHSKENIVPACVTCNYGKSTSPVEDWFRRQPFFCEVRWEKLKRATGVSGRRSVGQLSFSLVSA